MGTIHGDVVEELCKEYMSTPEGPGVIYKYLEMLKGSDLSDQIGQYHARGYTMEDAWVYGMIRARFLSGDLTYIFIEVGETPSRDSAVDENNAKLRRVTKNWEFMAANFRPEVGRGERDDGIFSWAEPIKGERHISGRDDGKIIVDEIEISPGWVPLEVGTTASSKTYWHIIRNGGVARWAYDSKFIVLFLSLNTINSNIKIMGQDTKTIGHDFNTIKSDIKTL